MLIVKLLLANPFLFVGFEAFFQVIRSTLNKGPIILIGTYSMIFLASLVLQIEKMVEMTISVIIRDAAIFEGF